MSVSRYRLLFPTLLFVPLVLLAACASPAQTPARYGVSVHALNYSSREVAYIAVEQPGHPEGGAGGDALNPYGGGGDICCFPVPAKWRHDFRVVVVYQFFPESEYRRLGGGGARGPGGGGGGGGRGGRPGGAREA